MKVNDILKWENEYEDLNPYFVIYKELVLQNHEHPRKFELLGAWETGNIQTCNEDVQYQDENGKSYCYTNRWQEGVSRKFEACQKISKKQIFLKNQTPLVFSEEEPDILNYLRSFHGIGPVFSFFCLHCIYPQIYPLYNEQIFRAYKYMISHDKEIPQKVESNWQAYKGYRNFFNQKVKELGIENEYWRLYKALWAYGNRLSQEKIQFQEEENVPTSGDSNLSQRKDGTWLSSNTLGPKAKSFNWRLTNTNYLIVSREFKGGKLKETPIPRNELDKIDRFVTQKDDWVD
ncbi:MAG: hypothetical protein ACOC2F_03070, partial [Bacteroidota bacterium]